MCDDFVLCAAARPPVQELDDNASVQVEVTLLVLRMPEGQAGGKGNVQCRKGVQQQQVLPAVPLAPRQSPAVPQRLPASSWNMLSAMAGGAAAGSTASTAAGHLDKPTIAAKQQSAVSIPIFSRDGRPRAQQQQEQKPKQAQQAATSSTPPLQWGPVQQTQSLPATASLGAAVQPPRGGVGQHHEQQRMTVSDYLVKSLTSQSLDLPPAVSGVGEQ